MKMLAIYEVSRQGLEARHWHSKRFEFSHKTIIFS